MKAGIFIFGLLGAIFAGAAVLLTMGEGPALITFLIFVALAIGGFFVARNVGVWLMGINLAAFLIGLGVLAWGSYTIFQALTETEGEVAQADAAMLATADAKVDAIEDSAAFRLELTEEEMTAYVLDGLAENEDNPLANVTLDVVDPAAGETQGLLLFNAEFKGGGVEADGAVTATLESGAVLIELEDLDMGLFTVPGVAEGALEDLIEEVADLNKTLAENRADVQSIVLGNDRVVIVGTQASTDVLTAEDLLAGLQASAAAASSATTPPPERFGPGVVNSTATGGSPAYVALGDSLAANVGVDQAQDGYVSRFHNQLQIADGAQYGLQNFGISGETTGTMIRGGQLDNAVAFIEANDVDYVTINIGANNLLGHLGSADCSASITSAGCTQRMNITFPAYEADMNLIFDTLQDAAPDATIIFMTSYNPFSLGFADSVEFEAQTDQILADFNAIAVGLAQERGIVVADGQTPMQGTTAATTHMIDTPPDIHPNEIGYDVLTGALVDARG